MEIILFSDTHIGMTKKKHIEKMLKEIEKLTFDLLVIAGDYCGGLTGFKTLGETVRVIRQHLPNKPILSTIGNHDFWCVSRKSRRYKTFDFDKNYQNIVNIFKSNNIHFIDEDGVYRLTGFEKYPFIGCCGWYHHPNPNTNDCLYLPDIYNNQIMNNYLSGRAYKILNRQLYHITHDDKPIFLSHFPVVKGGDDDDDFDNFNWSKDIGKMMIEEYGCKYFLEGHTHKFWNGEFLKYNCGSDYYQPRYLKIHID